MAIGGNTLAQLRDDEVEYYGQNGEEPYGMNVRRMDSHGGWIATPADLVRFMMHVGGFEMPACILKPETIMAMTAPSAANPRYASGWAVNRANIWWHNGSLPGTEAIAVRTHSGLCWAAFANTHRPKSDMGLELDRLIWAMARKVKTWRV
jgi:hypothetical protein